jgi:DNA-binding beta-propeller fold protein YncE
MICKGGAVLRAAGALVFFALGAGSEARAQLAVSSNDGKQWLDNGTPKVPPSPTDDNVTIIDLSASPPKVVGEVAAPASIVGPPTGVAVAKDESFALVTAGQAVNPSDKTKWVLDGKLSVIDLKASPPKVLATHEVGKGAAGVTINRAGTLAIVANRGEGTLSVFKISGNTLTPHGEKIKLGDEKSAPAGIVFTRDDKTAFVTRDGDNRISVLNIDGDKVEYAKRDLYAGMRPYGIDITRGDFAVVANIGLGMGDQDTMSVIDLKASPPRVVNTVTVGQTPEGIKLSPDGKFVAVGVMNGSNKPKESPFWSKGGALQIWSIGDKGALAKVAEAPIGVWCQGIAWAKDGKSLLAQCAADREIIAFAFDGKALSRTGAIKTTSFPSSIRTAEP